MTRSTLPTPRTAALPAGVLTPDLRRMLRGMLEQQRAFRVDQLVQLCRPGLPGPLGCADDRIAVTLVAGARGALRDVQKALWRMDEGTYGRCTDCGHDIAVPRLEILPQVALCLPCQRGAAA